MKWLSRKKTFRNHKPRLYGQHCDKWVSLHGRSVLQHVRGRRRIRQYKERLSNNYIWHQFGLLHIETILQISLISFATSCCTSIDCLFSPRADFGTESEHCMA